MTTKIRTPDEIITGLRSQCTHYVHGICETRMCRVREGEVWTFVGCFNYQTIALIESLGADRPAISISHRDGRWWCECTLVPELNASSVTLYALLHAVAGRVDGVVEGAVTTAAMARAGQESGR